MTLSDQALNSIMLLLQKSLYEQSDITVPLKELEFVNNEEDKLVVTNPPTFTMEDIWEKSK